MHILLLHQAFALIEEAGGTRHHEIAQQLARLGQQVTVIAGRASYLSGQAQAGRAQILEDGLRLIRPQAYSSWHRSFFHRLLSFFSFMLASFAAGLRQRRVDIVWGTSPPLFQAVSAWLVARMKRAPFLFEVRDLWPRFAVDVGVLRNPVLIVLSRWLESFLYHRADLIVVNSPGFVEHVQARGGKRVEVVPNGVDPAMFNPQDDGLSFRREQNLDSDFLVVYAGAHGLSNDLDVVLEAAALLKQEAVSFLLIGGGKEKRRLIEKANSLGLPRLRFLDPLPKIHMGRALAAADACLAILKPIEAYKTTYPNKVFDYMAAGRPVLLAIDGAIREVVEAAGAGLFVRPGDPTALAEAIRELRQDPERRTQMGERGRRCVETEFARADQSARLLRLMEEIVGGGSA